MFNLHHEDDELNVFFFDDDNIVSCDGLSYERPKRQTTRTIGSSDCYMIKCGSTELLVDCGYQSMTSYGLVSSNYRYNDEFVKLEMRENLLRKIATVMSPDGVLDYLIVTHSDFDHIAGLIATGGLFDCFLNNDEIMDLNGNKIKFNKINYIIDFDSGLVKKFSDISLEKSTRLIRSDYYQAYVSQRDKLVKKGTSYCPASALFDNTNLEEQKITIDEDNKAKGIPTKIKEKIEKAMTANPNLDYPFFLLDENSKNNAETIKNAQYKKESIFDKEVGGLSVIKTSEEEDRYYYALKFNKAELRILYNWHYDYIFRSSFNNNYPGFDSTQTTDKQDNVYDSQDANNISVCFEIIKDNFKFLSTGDLGGNGEDGLLNYYDNTEVLKGANIFKASHHGSTYNGENSERLFKLCRPRVIVITGCAIFKNANWSSSSDDPIMSAMIGRTKINQKFFDNVSSAFAKTNVKPYIFCTNITAYRNMSGVPYFESSPFYGDVKIRFKRRKLYLSYSYSGSISAYISQTWNSDYFKKNNVEFKFETKSNGKFLSFQDTAWFENIGYNFGGE